MYQPWVLGNPRLNSSEDFSKELSVNANVGSVVILAFSVQLLKNVIELTMELPSPNPWFDPPPPGSSLTLLPFPPTAPHSNYS